MKQTQTKLPYEVFSDFEDEIAKNSNIPEFKSGKYAVDYRAVPIQLIVSYLAKQSYQELEMIDEMVKGNRSKSLEPLLGAISIVRCNKMTAILRDALGVKAKPVSRQLTLNF